MSCTEAITTSIQYAHYDVVQLWQGLWRTGRERGQRRGDASTSLSQRDSAVLLLCRCSLRATATSCGLWRPNPSLPASGPLAVSTVPWRTADSTNTSSTLHSPTLLFTNKNWRREPTVLILRLTGSRRWCTATSQLSANRNLPTVLRREEGGGLTALRYSPLWWWEGRTTAWPHLQWGSARRRGAGCSSTDFTTKLGKMRFVHFSPSQNYVYMFFLPSPLGVSKFKLVNQHVVALRAHIILQKQVSGVPKTFFSHRPHRLSAKLTTLCSVIMHFLT